MTFLRPIDVQKKMKISRAYLYTLIKNGLFPKPVKFQKKMSLWNEAEVNKIMSMPIAWAKGLPLTADSYETKFYKKD